MATINSVPTLSYTDLYSSFTEIPSGTMIGQLEFGSNGKAYRLAKVGAAALVVGNTLQSPAVDTQFDGQAVAVAAAVGATQISITNGTTAITADQFDGGTLAISTNSASGTNLGDEYTIVAHTTGGSGATIIYYLDRPIRHAVTTATTTVAIRKSPWGAVIQSTGGTATGTPAGVAIYEAAAASYCWVQTKGVTSVLSDASTFAVGSLVGPSVSVAGAVGVFVAGTARTFVGFCMGAQNTTHTIPVQLLLD